MRKFVLVASLCSLFLLAGCNTDNANRNNDTAGDVERGVNDTLNDTRDVIDDTIDTVDPNRSNNGGVNESTIDNNGAYPNGSSNPNVDNGVTAPGAPSVNQEGIIEDKADRDDKDKIDNH